MKTPLSATLVITCDEALLIAAHLKLHARRMEHASDCALPGLPQLPTELGAVLKKHSAVFEQFADKLYAPFVDQKTQRAVDVVSDRVAEDLRNL
jgi:hypothetical protein